jgi:hypothetical protein
MPSGSPIIDQGSGCWQADFGASTQFGGRRKPPSHILMSAPYQDETSEMRCPNVPKAFTRFFRSSGLATHHAAVETPGDVGVENVGL